MILFIAIWFLAGFISAPIITRRLEKLKYLEEPPFSILNDPKGVLLITGTLLGWITAFTVIADYLIERKRRRYIRKLKNMKDKMHATFDQVEKIDPDQAREAREAYDKLLKRLEDED